MKTLEDLNVSPETIKSIKRFLLKTSIPRIAEERKKEAEERNKTNE